MIPQNSKCTKMEVRLSTLSCCMMVFLAMAMGSSCEGCCCLILYDPFFCGLVDRFFRGLLGGILGLVCTVMLVLVDIGI